MSHLGYNEFDPEAACDRVWFPAWHLGKGSNASCGLILGTQLTQILLVAMYPTFSHYPLFSNRTGLIPHFIGETMLNPHASLTGSSVPHP